MKGGYQIINFKGIKIDDETGANIPGIYDAIEGNSGKMLICTGINNDGTFLPEQCVVFTVSETIFHGVLVVEMIPATQSENAGTPAQISVTEIKVESDDDVSIITTTVTSA